MIKVLHKDKGILGSNSIRIDLNELWIILVQATSHLCLKGLDLEDFAILK